MTTDSRVENGSSEGGDIENQQALETSIGTSGATLIEVDKYITVALKASCLLLITGAIFLGRACYNQYIHTGPTCSDHKADFTYWLGSESGRIVSIETKLGNNVNGTSLCYGQFQYTNTKHYVTWSGKITRLDDGSFIGSATLPKLF